MMQFVKFTPVKYHGGRNYKTPYNPTCFRSHAITLSPHPPTRRLPSTDVSIGRFPSAIAIPHQQTIRTPRIYPPAPTRCGMPRNPPAAGCRAALRQPAWPCGTSALPSHPPGAAFGDLVAFPPYPLTPFAPFAAPLGHYLPLPIARHCRVPAFLPYWG